MKKFLFGILVFGLLGTKGGWSSQIVINETMYNPSTEIGGQYNEWIELYNSGTEAVSLQGWKFYNDSPRILVLYSGAWTIAPGSYCITSFEFVDGETINR